MPTKTKVTAKKTTVKKGVKSALAKAKSAPKKTAAPAKKKAVPVKKAAPVKKGSVAKAKKTVAPKVIKKAKATVPAGIPEQLLQAAMKVLDERKAEDIVSVDARGRSAMADYIIIASGGSARMLGAMAEYLREAFFKLGVRKLRVEGLPQGDWVLIDAGDVLIHLFRPEVRDFYHIEDIWSATKPAK